MLVPCTGAPSYLYHYSHSAPVILQCIAVLMLLVAARTPWREGWRGFSSRVVRGSLQEHETPLSIDTV
jgi:hypothetical protein